MNYKTVFVAASPGKYTHEGFLGGESEKESECWIDGEGLAQSCEKACNELSEQGYEVVSITEISRGSYQMIGQGGAGWGLNHGVLVTARRA